MNRSSVKGRSWPAPRYYGVVVMILTCAWLCAPTTGWAQTSTASINGTVRDATGGVVPGVGVILTNTQTNVERRARTNEGGFYVFLDVIPGKYQLQAARTGFKTSRVPPFTLQVNQTATFDVNLELGEVSQEVTVTGTAAELQSSTAELGAVVGEQQVVDLPLNGRNFTQLLALTPGVSPINVSQSAGGFAATTTADAAVTFPSVNGQNNKSNVYLLDGVPNGAGTFFGSSGSSCPFHSHDGNCCVSTSTSVTPSDQTSPAGDCPRVATSGAAYTLGLPRPALNSPTAQILSLETRN